MKLNICLTNTSPWTRHSCLAPELPISEPGWDRWPVLSHYINDFPTRRQACQIFTASYVETRYTHTVGQEKWKTSSCFFTSLSALTKYLQYVYTEGAAWPFIERAEQALAVQPSLQASPLQSPRNHVKNAVILLPPTLLLLMKERQWLLFQKHRWRFI